MKTFNIIILVFLLQGCSSTSLVKNTLEGMWALDEIQYGKYNIIYCYKGNAIIFNEDNVLESLIASGNCPDDIQRYNEVVEWDVFKTDSIPLMINIKTQDSFLNGNHKLKFLRDEERKLLLMEVTSDSLHFVAAKALFCFECKKETKIMNRLIKISGSAPAVGSMKKDAVLSL